MILKIGDKVSWTMEAGTTYTGTVFELSGPCGKDDCAGELVAVKVSAVKHPDTFVEQRWSAFLSAGPYTTEICESSVLLDLTFRDWKA